MLLVLQLVGAGLTPGFVKNPPLQALILVLSTVLVVTLTRIAHKEQGIYPKKSNKILHGIRI